MLKREMVVKKEKNGQIGQKNLIIGKYVISVV
jgi:hypothetical protein